MKYLSAVICAMLFLTINAQPILAQSGDDVFQQALQKEQAEGDLEGAIGLYQKIVNNLTDARDALVARALLQMGKSYERLGEDLVDEAREAYERIVRDYSDQPRVVAEAQSRLDGLMAAMAHTRVPDEPKSLIVQKVLDREFYGSLSPDGRYFTEGYWDGNGNLGIYDMQTEELRSLTHNGKWGREISLWADWSIFSPDSKHVAYQWWEGEEIQIRIVDINGGEPRIVTRFDESGISWVTEWTKDGKYILAVREEPAENPERDRIVLIDVETGETIIVKSLPDEIHTSSISMSPDGEYIAYETSTDDIRTPRNIHIVSTDGQFDQPLVDHPSDDSQPLWTPDGSGIVYLSDRSGSPGIWYVEVAEGVQSSNPRFVHSSDVSSSYGFTSDGTFYFSENQSDQDISVANIDLDQKTIETLPALRAKDFEVVNERPFWSPDGSKLAYVSARERLDRVIIIRDSQNGEERELHPDLPYVNPSRSPQWFPDGESMLLYGRTGKGHRPKQYRTDVETGQMELITDQGDLNLEIVSRDGKSLIGFPRDPDPLSSRGLVVEYNIESGKVRQIGETGLRTILPTLSPDGSQLAYFDRDPEDTERLADLVVMSMENGSKQILLPGRGEARMAYGPGLNWTPDGKHLLLAFRNEDETMKQFHLVNLVTGERTAIGDAVAVTTAMRQASLSPDGKQIAYGSGKTITSLWAMKNLVADE